MENLEKQLQLIKKVKRTIILIVVLILTFAEIMLMIFNSEIAFLMAAGMLILCIPDTIIAFIRHEEFRWGDFCITMLYLILLIINLLIK